MNQTLNLVRVEDAQPRSKRFDLFKGRPELDGSVTKIRTVGVAVLPPGFSTHALYLNTFVKDVFFLVPARNHLDTGDYVIMSRQPNQKPGKKYTWRCVGEAKQVHTGPYPLLCLNWDLIGAGDIYMRLLPNSETAENAFTQSLKQVLAVN